MIKEVPVFLEIPAFFHYLIGVTPDPEGIRRMFARISGRYDLFNSINSLGMHGRWRKELVNWSGVDMESRVLDCATGTGDVAFAFQRAPNRPREIVGVDFCREMLEVAMRKGSERGSGIRFREADVLHLPFQDHTFDIVSIAFGVRNIPDLTTALGEMARVARPNGRIMVLESGRPGHPLFSKLAGLYFRLFVSGISGWMTGNRADYRYLTESTANFNFGEEFLKASRGLGCFRKMEIRPLSLGLVYLCRMTVG